ncbi:hypothetical protein SEVIR_1G223532v4 [Setaria viridis]|nr:uncharacterized protein LOC117855711 [Setaria viridis]
MDNLEFLAVRFHFGGEFTLSPGKSQYVRGRSAMSYIEMDKLSLPEIIGHLGDHMSSSDVLHLHWLRPGKELVNGLILLADDASCQMMRDHITTGGVADIYVEDISMEEGDNEGSYRSPSQPGSSNRDVPQGEPDSRTECEDTDTTSDEDYEQLVEDNSSADDDEAEQLKKFAKDIKRNIRADKLGVHGSQIEGENANALVPTLLAEVDDLQDVASPYYDSSDDYSYGF